MTYIFKNLGKTSTFEEFRLEHVKVFGADFYEFSDEIPKGIISEHNDEWVKYNKQTGCVEMWIDDGSDDEEIIDI